MGVIVCDVVGKRTAGPVCLELPVVTDVWPWLGVATGPVRLCAVCRRSKCSVLGGDLGPDLV